MKAKILAVILVACLIILNAFIASAACVKTKIMPLGDSITEGDGEILDVAYMVGYRQFLWQQLTSTGYAVDFVGSLDAGYAISGFDSNHEGHGGWNSQEIADNIYNWLAANPADIVLLHIGTNDIRFSNVPDIVNAIDNILTNISNYESFYNRKVTVILAQIINRTDDSGFDYQSKTSSLNSSLHDLVVARQAAGDRIILVDMEHAIVYPDDLYDGIHPKSSGYAKMENVWFPVLGEMLFTCTNSGNQAPNGVIDSPSADVTIQAGASVTFAGTGSDPDGNLPLSYLWQFGTGSGVPNSTLQDPGSVQFNVPGTYTVSFTVTDALGLADPTPAVRVITVLSSSPVISQKGWVLKYVDSQELVGENGAAVNAFDGNASTIWHTQYSGSSPAPPHEIQIDLGSTYNIDEFRYLPRQDGSVDGRIGRYEFYVSMDGVNWDNPVAVGSFVGNATEKDISFAPKGGRFIRLRALSEVNGNPWTSMAELNVLGGNQAPNGVIDNPSVDVTIQAGESVAFAGTGSDPDGNLPLSYSWQFGAGSGVPDSTVQDPGSVQFNVPGTYTVSFTVKDALGLSDTTPAVRVIYVRKSTTTTINAPSVTYNADGVVTVTVSSMFGTPTGNVSLTVDGGAAVTQTLNSVSGSNPPSSSATFTIAGLRAGIHTLNASFATQGSFAASTVNDTLDITARPLTITATAANKMYDRTTNVSVAYGDNRLTGEVLTVNGVANFVDKNVGMAKVVIITNITITGIDSGNYALTATTASTTADIIAPDGDLDGDGVVSVTDALRALRIAGGLIIPTAADNSHGDVAPLVSGIPQPNDSIDIGDVVVILRKAVGLVNW